MRRIAKICSYKQLNSQSDYEMNETVATYLSYTSHSYICSIPTINQTNLQIVT